MRRSELIEKIRAYAIIGGKFDKYALLSASEQLLKPIGDELAGLVVQRIVRGSALRIIAVGHRPLSVCLAGYVAATTNLPLNLLDKTGDGLMLQGRIDGSRAILIEDVLSTGGVAEMAAKTVRARGLVMTDALFAVELDPSGVSLLEGERLTATSVFTAQDLGL